MSNLAPTGLHYLGNYTRSIPASLNRMMENAYDWEHLPFVHPSSFASIALIDEGDWGWRCKTTLPPAAGGGEQVVELLVDKPGHYWATTVLEGTGEGVQIHTQASQARPEEPRQIDVDVRFYLPAAPETEEQSAMILGYLQAQYKTLYDEDAALMTSRQDALDARKAQDQTLPETADLGEVDLLDRAATYPVELAQGRFTVRYHNGAWIAHASVCPHMLGPLSGAVIDEAGTIICPWHGYAFSLADGEEKHKRCGALPAAPSVGVINKRLVIGQ